MRTIPSFVAIAILCLLSNHVMAAEYLDEIESEVYQATGTQAEITSRARSCIAQLITNAELEIGDATSGADTIGGIAGAGQRGHSERIAGGAVIEDAIPDQGIIVANSRVNISRLTSDRSARSRLVFMAKDSRFKIRHNHIEFAQKQSGYMHNPGYSRVGKWMGSGWQEIQKALEAKSAEIAACVTSHQAGDDW